MFHAKHPCLMPGERPISSMVPALPRCHREHGESRRSPGAPTGQMLRRARDGMSPDQNSPPRIILLNRNGQSREELPDQNVGPGKRCLIGTVARR
jgi:hypothetical protein